MSALKKYIQSIGSYGELRTHHKTINFTAITDGKLTDHHTISDAGSSCRVFHNGFWGMAHTCDTTPSAMQSLVKYATRNADILSDQLCLSKTNHNISLEGFDVYEAIYPGKREISDSYLLELVYFYNDYIARACPELDRAQLSVWSQWEEKNIAVTTGSELYSVLPETTMHIRLESGGHALEESFCGQESLSYLLNGRESICKAIDILYEHLRRKINPIIINDAYASCVLSPKLTGKIIHEAVGHHSEADFVLDCLPYAPIYQMPTLSEKINIVDYAHTALCKACPLPIYIDDEGTPARDAHIVKRGKICSTMTNRETSALLNVPLTGNARASGYLYEPSIRMRNTALLPSEDTADEILSSVADGYYLVDGNDGCADITGEFVYHITIGYRIKNGKIRESLRDCFIWGSGADFLSSISMIGNDFEWHIDECTKKQRIKLSSGAPTVKASLNIGVDS